MCIRDDIASFDSCVLNNNRCESLWCKIRTNNKREINIEHVIEVNWQVKQKFKSYLKLLVLLLIQKL